MLLIIRHILVLFVCFGPLGAWATGSDRGPIRAPVGLFKSFKDWKAEKVAIATIRAEAERARLVTLKGKSFGDPRARREYYNQEQAVAQEQWNLEVALDLSVTDYAVLYLSQRPVSTRFQDAAARLSREEVAQILEAYIRATGASGERSSRLMGPLSTLGPSEP